MDLNNPLIGYSLLAGLGALLGLIMGITGTLGTIKLRNLGKPWVLTLPGTPNTLASLERRHLKDSAFEKKDGDEGKRFQTAGQAAYPLKKGTAVHIITDYGANLIAPSKDAVAADIMGGKYELPKAVASTNGMITVTATPKVWADRFMVWDPLLNWRAARENDMEDMYSSDKQKDPWYARIMPVLVILLVCLMIGFGLLIWKVLPLLSQVGH